MPTHLIWYPGHERLIDDIVRAEGVYLFDAAGRRYVDLESFLQAFDEVLTLPHDTPR